MMQKVVADQELGTHICPSCNQVEVKNNFNRCYGCYIKWKSVVNKCVQGGMEIQSAREKADEFYPWRWTI